MQIFFIGFSEEEKERFDCKFLTFNFEYDQFLLELILIIFLIILRTIHEESYCIQFQALFTHK